MFNDNDSPGSKAAERRTRIVAAARWCFLNFGYAKTTFEDISKRAGISRSLLYHHFRNKEELYTAVFTDWLISRHPAALQAASAPGDSFKRLIEVVRLLVLEPWSEMVGAPMGGEFFEACERLDPEIEARHREVALQCVTTITRDREAAEVFLLSLDGLLTDQPSVDLLSHRIHILAARFVQSANRQQ